MDTSPLDGEPPDGPLDDEPPDGPLDDEPPDGPLDDELLDGEADVIGEGPGLNPYEGVDPGAGAYDGPAIGDGLVVKLPVLLSIVNVWHTFVSGLHN